MSSVGEKRLGILNANVMRPWLRRCVFLSTFIFLSITALFMWFENYLVYPGWGFPSGRWEPPASNFDDVTFESEDGTLLHGWFLDHPDANLYLMVCHGNGETVGHMGPWLEALRQELKIAVFAFDYRGFGRSEGRPNEAGVLADGRAAHRWLGQRIGKKSTDIVIFGRSLGGAIAVDCAAQQGARGLILDRTFATLPEVAAQHYPWLPVRWLMRNRYESIRKIARYDGPLLQCHGDVDEVVPFESGKRLYEAAPSLQKEFVVMKGVGHNGAVNAEFHRSLFSFITQLRMQVK